jgi:hypothetical protein
MPEAKGISELFVLRECGSISWYADQALGRNVYNYDDDYIEAWEEGIKFRDEDNDPFSDWEVDALAEISVLAEIVNPKREGRADG